jgi:hypothetical protein
MKKLVDTKPCLGGTIGKKCNGERLHSTKYRGGKKLYCTPCLSIVLHRLAEMAASPVRLTVR